MQSDPYALFAGPLGFVILLLMFIWGILMFFAPFFWYGTWYQTKRLNKNLEAYLRNAPKVEPRIGG